MATLIVFDSTFGNTEMAARAVAEILGDGARVRTLRVDSVESGHLEGVTLLVVGSPTRGARPSPAMAAWLAKVPAGRLEGARVAAFVTAVAADRTGPLGTVLTRLLPPAAVVLERRLASLGGTIAAPAEHFFLEAATGPLRAGETDRARAWARALSARAQAP